MITSNTVYAVLDTYPDDLRSLFLGLEEPSPNPDEAKTEATSKVPHIEPKDSEQSCQTPKKKSAKKKARRSAKKNARRRASIRERLNSYVRDYSVDLQNLFDDIVATASETEGNNSINPGGAEPGTECQTNQSQSTSIAAHGSQYLKERLEIMLKRAKISVMPLTKKGSKKQCIKRKSRAKLLDKLDILRKKFQLIKKCELSLCEEKQENLPSSENQIKKIRKKQMKKIKKKTTKKNKPKRKRQTRKSAKRNIKIKKKQGIRRRLGSTG